MVDCFLFCIFVNWIMRKEKNQEIFLNTCLLNNRGFREGEFKILSPFTTVKKKIICKDKYGYCAVLPGDLRRGVTQKMSLKSAIFKTLYLKEFLNQTSRLFNSRHYRIVSEYTRGKDQIKILDNNGLEYSMAPKDLLKGALPSLKSALDKDKYILTKICSRNPFFRNGDVIYKSYFIKNQSAYAIVEDKYGEYIMSVSTAYTGSKPTIEVAVDKDENLRQRMKENGGDYDYSEVFYKSMTDKVNIKCNLHGTFLQKPANHIRGEGCPKCGTLSSIEKMKMQPSGWTHTNWISSANKSKYFDSFKCYIVKLKHTSTDEEFYKIGRTFTTLKKRFRIIKPYKIKEIIKLYEGEALFVINKELELLKLNKNYSYSPLINFGGHKECFSEIKYD